MRGFFRQVWSGSWMLFWAALLAWGGWWLLKQGWWLMGHHWELSGLAVCLVGILPIVMALHGVWLAILVLSGRMNVRMAKRKFRNGMADMIMYSRTGLWKE